MTWPESMIGGSLDTLSNFYNRLGKIAPYLPAMLTSTPSLLYDERNGERSMNGQESRQLGPKRLSFRRF